MLVLLFHQGGGQEKCSSLKLAAKEVETVQAPVQPGTVTASALPARRGASERAAARTVKVPALAWSLTWTMCLRRPPGPESRQTLISVFRDGSDAALPQLVLPDPLQASSGFVTLCHPACHP